MAQFLVQIRVNGYTGGEHFFTFRLSLETLTLCTPLPLVSYRDWVTAARWRIITFWSLLVIALIGHAPAALLEIKY